MWFNIVVLLAPLSNLYPPPPKKKSILLKFRRRVGGGKQNPQFSKEPMGLNWNLQSVGVGLEGVGGGLSAHRQKNYGKNMWGRGLKVIILWNYTIPYYRKFNSP